jgi:secernin
MRNGLKKLSVAVTLLSMFANAAAACDMVVVTPKGSADGTMMWGKNSNRDNEECMTFRYHQGGKHAAGETVKVSHTEIPQAPVTYSCMGGEPYWAWGGEIEMNEKGVCCGNELIYTKDPIHHEENGLNGHDLNRLAVERGATAYEAMHVIIDMIEKYGQGGNANPPSKSDLYVYWNSFLIVDPHEAWVLETSDRRWIARRVDPNEGVFALTNVPSIGAVYDECSPDLIEHAKEKGWYKDGDEFNFYMCYTDYTKGLASESKGARAYDLLAKKMGKITPADIMEAWRDNKLAGTFLESRFGVQNGSRVLTEHRIHNSIAGSAVAELRTNPEIPEAMRIRVWAAMASPDCSGYRPFYFCAKVPEELSIGESTYDEKSPWWCFDLLDRMARTNEDCYFDVLKAVWKPYEARMFRENQMMEKQAVKLFKDGKDEEAKKLISSFVQAYCDKSWNIAKGMKNVFNELHKVVPGPGVSFADPEGVSDAAAKVVLFQ